MGQTVQAVDRATHIFTQKETNIFYPLTRLKIKHCTSLQPRAQYKAKDIWSSALITVIDGGIWIKAYCITSQAHSQGYTQFVFTKHFQTP